MSRRVLIIEDHPETCEQLMGMLKRRGLDSECAASMSEALSTLKVWENQKFDCIISDLSLPDSSAEETLCLLSGFYEEGTPVRALTGVDDPDIVLQAKKLGVPLILKGTSAEGIMESILHAVADKHLDREAAEAILDNRKVVREVPVYRAAHFWDRWHIGWQRAAVVFSALTIIGTAFTSGAALYNRLTDHAVNGEKVRQRDDKVDEHLKNLDNVFPRVQAVENVQIQIVEKLDNLGKQMAENKRDMTHQLDRIEANRK